MSELVYLVTPAAFEKMCFFAKRLSECADVVHAYTVMLFGLAADVAYDALNALDRGETVVLVPSRDDDSEWLEITVITPLDDPDDRVYGFSFERYSATMEESAAETKEADHAG